MTQHVTTTAHFRNTYVIQCFSFGCLDSGIAQILHFTRFRQTQLFPVLFDFGLVRFPTMRKEGEPACNTTNWNNHFLLLLCIHLLCRFRFLCRKNKKNDSRPNIRIGSGSCLHVSAHSRNSVPVSRSSVAPAYFVARSVGCSMVGVDRIPIGGNSIDCDCIVFDA